MRSRAATLRFSVAALAVSFLVTACQRDPPPAAAPIAEPAPTPAPVAPPPPLGRADVLQAIDAAASAYAAGQAPEGEALVGRRFSVRQAFGCSGADAPAPADVAADGLARWSWSLDRRSIDIRLTPSDWTASALVAGGDGNWEAAEGIWLTRPWLRTESCPGSKLDPLSGPGVASPQSMGLVAVFERGGSRVGRRNGRAYAFTVRGEGDKLPPLPIGGYRLVLEGRFVAFADGRAVRCRADDVDQRPVCIAAVQLDRVAFEAADGEVLSEWRVG